MNERTLFLLDGVGAALSFLLSGLILPHFSDALGLSKELIYSLASFPAICMIFSFLCYGFIKSIKSWMILAIILANLSYCLISGSILVFHDGLSELGRGLLSVEIIVVMVVIILEIKVFQKSLKVRGKSL